jgi:5'-nucleotidase
VNILISNDDGYRSPGIVGLAKELADMGDVTIVAPERNRSGASNSLTGVNAGANLGDDVIYSGTVAAAMEGRFLGLPALAISLVLDGARQFATAARVARVLLTDIAHSPIPTDTILNVNVPDIPFRDLEGIEVTRLGHRHKAEGVVRSRDPRGRTIFWVGPAGPEQDAGPGTDFFAVAQRRVSVTPMQVDLTRHAALDATARWVGGLQLH